MRWCHLHQGMIVAAVSIAVLGCGAYREALTDIPPANTTLVPVVPVATAVPAGVAQAPALAWPSSPLVVSGYTVQPDDVLQITVYEEPDLTTRARVEASGAITLPFLGNVPVIGLTVTQIQQKLTELLAADYLVNPQVQVFIETYHPRSVVVTGAVNKPGSYALSTEKVTSVMEAIAMAGGFSEEAAPNGTRIIRMENGQEKTISVKVNDIVKRGGGKTKDVAVQSNDIVFVPESFF